MEEDLKIKMGSKDEVLWTNVKKEAEYLIKQSEDNLKIQTEVLKLAQAKILEEQEAFKN